MAVPYWRTEEGVEHGGDGVSVRVISWIFENSDTKGTDRLVLLAIADSADDDGSNAWPALDTIARKAGIGHRGAQQAVARLRERGLIRVEKQAGGPADMRADRRPNRYTVLMAGRTAVRPAEADGANEDVGRDAQDDTDGVHGRSPNPSKASVQEPEPSPAAPSKPRRPRKPDPIWDELARIFGAATPSECKRIGKAKREILEAWRAEAEAAGGTVEFVPEDVAAEITRRAREAWRRWGARPFGPEALTKHWTSLGTPAPPERRNGRGTVTDAWKDVHAAIEGGTDETDGMATDLGAAVRELPVGERHG